MGSASLPWLSFAQKKKVKDTIDATIITELAKRNWGNYSNQSAERNVLNINDYRGLMMTIGSLKYHLHKMDTDFLLRGQTKNYPIVPSLFRACQTHLQLQANQAWIAKVIPAIKSTFDPVGTDDEREALLQHYGLKTRWIDVVDHVQTALWFAFTDEKRNFDGSDIEDSTGYLYLIAYPCTSAKYAIVKDLRLKPADWLRPHLQQGFSIRLADPLSYERSFEHLRLATIVIQRDLLRTWSNSVFIRKDYLFPGEAFDKAVYYFNKSMAGLKKAGIGTEPPNI
jgi:hypothetical protein